MQILFSLVLGVALLGGRTDTPLLRIDHPGFTLWVVCAERAAVLFHYTAEADRGRLPREDTFTLDPEFSRSCQQSSTRSHRNSREVPPHDRGHLVPANHVDHLADGIRLSNRMTNILPQASGMNRGAWLRTEEIIECYRDIEPLEVWGGVLWGFDASNDHFVESHGVRTPDYFWKVVVSKRDPQRHIAWIVPNRSDATRGRLDSYLSPVADIEMFTGVKLPLPEASKHNLPLVSWPLPAGCDKG